MVPEIQSLYYSYLDPKEIAETPQIGNLENGSHEIVDALGGKKLAPSVPGICIKG